MLDYASLRDGARQSDRERAGAEGGTEDGHAVKTSFAGGPAESPGSPHYVPVSGAMHRSRSDRTGQIVGFDNQLIAIGCGQGLGVHVGDATGGLGGPETTAMPSFVLAPMSDERPAPLSAIDDVLVKATVPANFGVERSMPAGCGTGRRSSG